MRLRAVYVPLTHGTASDRRTHFSLNDLVDPDYEGTLLVAGHINDAGVITGVALDPDSGDEVAFVATPTGAGP